MTARRLLRDERMRLTFRHTCGALKSCASDDPIRYGSWCPTCTPDDGTAGFDWVPSDGWEPVFAGEGESGG